MPDIKALEICDTNFVEFGDRPDKVDDEWVIRLLKRYGNCNVNRFYNHNLSRIEAEVGKLNKIVSGNCFILEVIK